MAKKISQAPFCYVLCLVWALDQWSKWFVVHYVTEPSPVIGHWLHITPTFNDGAAWNLLSGQRFALILFAVLFLLGGYLLRHRLGLESMAKQFFIACIAAGILGNLLDRVQSGLVVDFIDIHLPFYRWPAFNVADGAICLGTICYFIHDWYFSRRGK